MPCHGDRLGSISAQERNAAEKRRLWASDLSNCTWKDGQLTAAYRQPFDLLVKNVVELKRKMPAS
jgi:hypothetical protein